MKSQENYLYCCDTTDEPNAADEAVLIPSSKVISITPGVIAGTQSISALTLFYEGFGNDGSAGAVQFACTAEKQKEAMDDLVAAINSNPGNGFVVLADVQNSVFCSPHITGCTVDDEV